MSTLATLFVVVLLLNLIPAFAPPTWMAMSWVGFNVPEGNPIVSLVRLSLRAVAMALAQQNPGIICQSAGWIYDHDLIAASTVENLGFFGIALSDAHNMLYGALSLDGENAPLFPAPE